MDTARIRDKLDELFTYLSELEQDLPATSDEYMEDRRTRRAVERDFELSCEALLDICNMVIAGKSLGKPLDNKDSVEKLARNSVIDRGTADRLKDMVGFRNLLVHRYAKIDDEQAYRNLVEGLDDFYVFLERVENLLKSE